jgi:hypothetical protein
MMTRHDVEVQDSQGRTLLNYCAKNASHMIRVVQSALELGADADVNHRDPTATGRTLLLRWAADLCSFVDAEMLLKAGADPSEYTQHAIDLCCRQQWLTNICGDVAARRPSRRGRINSRSPDRS